MPFARERAHLGPIGPVACQNSRMRNGRPLWSWAQTEQDADAFRREARRILGQRLAEVHYITLDYGSDKFRGAEVGPRLVEAADEWASPTWRHSACDTVDYAVEFRLDIGAVFTVSWDSPGAREGVGLRVGAAVGMAVTELANAAIWEVSHQAGWRELVGRKFTSAELVYEPWDGAESLWCRRIDLEVEAEPVTLLLAEGVWNSDALAPSADNIAVIFGSDVDVPWAAAGS